MKKKENTYMINGYLEQIKTYPIHASVIKDMMNVREIRSTIVFHESDVCLEDDDVLEHEDCIFIHEYLCTL